MRTRPDSNRCRENSPATKPGAIHGASPIIKWPRCSQLWPKLENEQRVTINSLTKGMEWHAATGKAAAVAFAPYFLTFVTVILIIIPFGADSMAAGAVSPLTMAHDARIAFGGSDSGSLLAAAISLHDEQTLSANYHWVYNLWPPGLVFVYVAMVWIEDATSFPFAMQMILLTSAVWAVFIGTFFTYFRRVYGLTAGLLFAVAMFLSTAMTSWGTGRGVFYGDSFGAVAMSFSLLAMMKLAASTRFRERVFYACISGLFLGVAAYFRAVFELVATATLATAVILIVVGLVAGRVRRRTKSTPVPLSLGFSLLIAGGIAQLATLPWRLFAGTVIRPGDFRWSTVSSLASPARWVPESELRAGGAGFLADGHSNWSCLSDPTRCDEIFLLESSTSAPYSGGPNGYFTPSEFDALTITSALERPFTVISERLGAIAFGFASDDGAALKTLALPESILLVAAFVATVVFALKTRRLTQPPIVLFLISVGVQLATLLVLHQEPRYFMTIDITTIVVAVYILGAVRIRDRNLDVGGPGMAMNQRGTALALS